MMEEALHKHELWNSIEKRVDDAVKFDNTVDPVKRRVEIAADLEKDGIDVKAPHSGIKITTGVGKSRAIRRMIAHFIRRAKAKGLPHRVLYLVGTHKLADEGKQALPGGVTSAIWQGRGANKLNTDNEPMCLNIPAVEAAIKIGAEVESTACRKAKRGQTPIYCRFYEECWYQKQKALAAAADVVFAVHEILLKVPSSIGEFGLIVVDEAFWQDAAD